MPTTLLGTARQGLCGQLIWWCHLVNVNKVLWLYRHRQPLTTWPKTRPSWSKTLWWKLLTHQMQRHSYIQTYRWPVLLYVCTTPSAYITMLNYQIHTQQPASRPSAAVTLSRKDTVLPLEDIEVSSNVCFLSRDLLTCPFWFNHSKLAASAATYYIFSVFV